jgi:hypothetical protein
MIATYRPSVLLYLERRTLLQNGKFRIKVEVVFRVKKGRAWKYPQHYRPTEASATPEEFLLIKSRSAKGALKEQEERAHRSMREVETLLDEYPTLTINQFKAWKSGRSVSGQFKLKPLFERMIKKRSKLKTVSIYSCAMISIFKYSSEEITLDEITPEWLKDFRNGIPRSRKIH